MSYRASIVAFYSRHPKATQEQVRKATGAPKATVRFVYASLVQRGHLEQRAVRDVLSQPCAP